MIIPREPFDYTQGYSHERSRVGLRRDYTQASQVSKSYLLGLLHDATTRPTTYRIATKSKVFADFLVKEIKKLKVSAWNYKEGKARNLWIVEFSKSLLKNVEIDSKKDKIDYIRGYFDAEGGMAKSPKVRFYLSFGQKNFKDLLEVRNYLEELKINCGRIHNPSKRVDPNYWRFFVRSNSYQKFARIVGSSHPDKIAILRMKI